MVSTSLRLTTITDGLAAVVVDEEGELSCWLGLELAKAGGGGGPSDPAGLSLSSGGAF